MKRLMAKKYQQGMTLIEVLIALALSAVLSTVVYQTVISNRTNIEISDSYAVVQESARLAMEILSRDIRMLGYLGCVNNVSKLNIWLDTDDSDYDASLHDFSSSLDAVDNYDPGSDAAYATLLGATPVTDSDLLINRSATMSDLTVDMTPSDTAANLHVAGPQSQKDLLTLGQVVMVTDCTSADVFTVSNDTGGGSLTVPHNIGTIAGGPDNKQKDLSVVYDKTSQILIMNSTVHFIAPSAVIPGVNSLYKYSILNGGSVEMVPYVESLQFTYGVDSNGDSTVDGYMTAGEIATAGISMTDNVYSVKVEIVVAGDKDVGAPVPSGYTINGTAPTDGKLRKRYTRVVQIRNSAIGG